MDFIPTKELLALEAQYDQEMELHRIQEEEDELKAERESCVFFESLIRGY